MRSGGWIRVLALTALLAAACGSANPPAAGNPTSTAPGTTPVAMSSPSPTATNSRTPAPTSTPPSVTPCPVVQPAVSAASSRNLALVTLRGSKCVVVRDVTDISHSTTVGAFDQLPQSQFVSAAALSYVVGNKLFRVPVGGSPKTLVATTSQFVIAFAWSPDGNTLAYVTPGTSGMELHLVSAGNDRVVAGSMPALPGVGCEVFCPTADVWDLRLSYSPDGTLISFVDSVVVPAFRIWSSDGRLVSTSNSQSHSMSVWSGKKFYFQDADGVAVWSNRAVSTFLPGVHWIRPKVSPDGKTIVYETRDSAGWAHTSIVDTTYGLVGELKMARAEPVFLTSRFIWYRGERACVAADYCPTRYPSIPNGKTYIFDLQTATESASVITSVADVWPHAA
jgi:hypothetical protein